jgi:hypothetical protein
MTQPVQLVHGQPLTAPEPIATVLREEIRALRDAVRDLAAEQHDIVTPEQVAERLSTTTTKLTRAMNQNVLPRGVVWFETPLGRYFSWRRLVEWITAAGTSSYRTYDETLSEDDVWRKPA